jgi:hypothetical protein
MPSINEFTPHQRLRNPEKRQNRRLFELLPNCVMNCSGMNSNKVKKMNKNFWDVNFTFSQLQNNYICFALHKECA